MPLLTHGHPANPLQAPGCPGLRAATEGHLLQTWATGAGGGGGGSAVTLHTTTQCRTPVRWGNSREQLGALCCCALEPDWSHLEGRGRWVQGSV